MQVDAFVDAFEVKASTCDLVALGGRLKAAREALKLSRPAFVEKFGGSVRTLENNEAGRNEPGAWLFFALASNGINANWLLNNEGPMLMADLVANLSEESARPADERLSKLLYSRLLVNQALCAHDAAAQPAAPTFNVAAFQAILIGILEAGAPPNKAVAAAFEFYETSIKRGLITADGTVPQGKTAA